MNLLDYTEQLKEAAERWSGDPGVPNRWSRQHPRGIPMYRSGLVEGIFARAHPITPGLWFGPFIGYGLYRVIRDNVAFGAVLFVLGVLLWTLAEYLLHRFPFHRVVRPPRPKLPAFFMHGYHHEFPNDPMRLVAPISASWPLGLLTWVVLRLAMGPDLVWPLFAGLAVGYVGYDWIHYYTHHFRPKTRVGKFLRRYHMEHHYRDPGSHFGISSPLWDYVFRTVRRNKRASDPPRQPMPESG